MHRDFTLQKRAILIMLGLLLAADLGLAIYSWRLSSSPQTSQKEFDDEDTKLKLLRGDIHSAQLIKDDMPATRADCEKFEKSLPVESTSSSTVTSELDEVAKKSGLRIDTLTNRPKEIPNRGMIEMTIEATVSGDYGSVVRFLNGLQRSQRFYVVDGLVLATDSQTQAATGLIRVALHVRTYFRGGA
ncbi:MAG TPA: type 4a pilus biogenesis protein PilO [Candidatus Acidoferrum sp.]|nr:type 4a pilus biogenesis protein PilO [Candidatus Acidoferrum sp.]